jgi:magnesium transporter
VSNDQSAPSVKTCIHLSIANRALEAMFISVVSSLHSELEVLENLITKLLSDLEDSIQQDKLKDMLQYTKKLSDFYQGVISIRDAINEVLDQGK